MSDLLEFFLELLLNLVGGLLEPWFGSDTLTNRLFWGIIVLLLGGLVWWELR